MNLNVLTYNTLFAGRDGSDDRRAQAQIGLINDMKPDVFLMQEAKGFDTNGNAWLYALEKAIGASPFVRSVSTSTVRISITQRPRSKWRCRIVTGTSHSSAPTCARTAPRCVAARPLTLRCRRHPTS